MILELLTATGMGAALLKLFDTWAAKRKPASEAAAELIKLAIEASGSSVEQLLSRLDEADRRNADMADEIAALKAENVECRREGEQLRQNARQLEQKIDSLTRQLRDVSATSPGGALHGAMIEMAGGEARLTRPAPVRKPRRKTP